MNGKTALKALAVSAITAIIMWGLGRMSMGCIATRGSETICTMNGTSFGIILGFTFATVFIASLLIFGIEKNH